MDLGAFYADNVVPINFPALQDAATDAIPPQDSRRHSSHPRPLPHCYPVLSLKKCSFPQLLPFYPHLIDEFTEYEAD